jgi:hypothetical protein
VPRQGRPGQALKRQKSSLPKKSRDFCGFGELKGKAGHHAAAMARRATALLVSRWYSAGTFGHVGERYTMGRPAHRRARRGHVGHDANHTVLLVVLCR